MNIYIKNNSELLQHTLQAVHYHDPMTPSIPDNAVIADTELPQIKESQAYLVSGERNKDRHYTVSANVSVVADYRNVDTYNTETGEREKVTEIGELPSHVTTLKRDNTYQIFEAKKQEWTLTAEAKSRKLKDDQAQACELIKSMREDKRHSGVKVNDKWFHTDESSRLQYITLNGLPALPGDFQWKTMDNSFVSMTSEFIQQIVMESILREQEIFANAEIHRAAMLQDKKPLEYDFSGGWGEFYQ